MSCLVSLSLSLSVSLCFCLSLSLCLSVSLSVWCCCVLCCVVLCVVVLCGVVWCVCVCVCGVCVCVCVVVGFARLGTQKKPPCVDSKRPRVYRHHAHMCYHMRRGAGTHGDVLNLHTEVFGTDTRRRGGRGRGGHCQFC